MDIARFDALLRSLAIAPSRRSLARGLAALAIGGAAWRREAEAKSCGPCRRKKKGKCKPKPFGTPCGACRQCEGGRCIAQCQGDEECVNGFCIPPCEPPCQSNEDCFYGVCYTQCNPPCGSDEGCVDGTCVDQTGGCEAPDNRCADLGANCPNVGAGFSCALTNTGDPFCTESTGCSRPGADLCQSDGDCRTQGWGPNARCIFNCSECDGGNACAASYLDF